MAIAVLLSVGATKKDALQEQHITHVLSLLESAEPHFPEVSEFFCLRMAVFCAFFTSCDLFLCYCTSQLVVMAVK